KTCSVCGAIHELKLSDRTMNCECGNTLDRDLNAAINLKNYAVSSTVLACGEKSADAKLLVV
ncbi:zinc ribbon domain-containing protein, partial [Methylicorpusculum sp.]